METIHVTLTRNGQPWKDIELPHEVPVQVWLQQITAIGKSFWVETEDLDRYLVEACRPNGEWQRIPSHLTLAEVDIWDGAFLRLHEGGFGTTTSGEAVAGWKPILDEDGSLFASEEDDTLGTFEFTWKKLD